MRILLVGGGTGGHFYPLIAVAETLRAKETAGLSTTELYYMGPNAYDRSLLTDYGIKFLYCPAGKIRRYFSFLNFVDLFKISFGIIVALIQLFIYYPDVIFSKGGYTSVPVLLAAWFYRIPVVIHESDSRPGMANKLAARFAEHIAITFPEVSEYFPKANTALTGIPIRSAIRQPVADPFGQLGLDPTIPVIYVTGGSLGAVRINNLILDSLDELLPQYQILHQAGKGKADIVRASAQTLITDPTLTQRYFVVESLNTAQVAAAQSAAALIICRAGTTTLTEAALHRKPTIVIPLPIDVSHDQRANAYAYARATKATVMEEQNLNDSLLSAEIHRIMADQTVYDEMVRGTENFIFPHASETIAQVLIDTGLRHGS